jgi:DNA (cytosine-5)-methyltransferase 1
MRHGSLFSGIGGFDLAAEWCGWENVFQVEIDEFAQKVLAYHFPNVKRYSDVKEFDGTPYKGAVDVISGGFPCQPYSSAGKRKGKNDDRHLWPEMLRIIREISPTYVVGENVYGLYSWNDGLVFDEIISDLETLGYEVRTLFIPAVAVNAPHRRMRIWFVAYANGAGSGGDGGTSGGTQKEVRRQDASDVLEPFCDDGDVANSENNGQSFAKSLDERRKQKSHNGNKVRSTSDATGGGRTIANAKRKRLEHSSKSGGVGESKGKARKRSTSSIKATGKKRDATIADGIGLRRETDWPGKSELFNGNSKGNNWQDFPTQSPVCCGNDGISRQLDGITFPKWRSESIKAYGNAIVPQVAYQIFEAIKQTHNQ